ncbi:hypothetical protein SODALDRAFT_362733 [Sodiomyces alkalinus F11]|uniref:Uncharacterized protein n=1 Tax=Sodiomyces alkalinus (strain CBS 110278 / VKM F-3762 / F11) TaxID=1314773 RepID=A0A3N2PN80_SODAK|nr:hypothetical protein SODALDRAFT_362733 [Sodiomyces alkalinus F11]ROT35884.1 hypothetical protein SODALDRAFT_362733 [Sodiomyces alkalinus F11]
MPPYAPVATLMVGTGYLCRAAGQHALLQTLFAPRLVRLLLVASIRFREANQKMRGSFRRPPPLKARAPSPVSFYHTEYGVNVQCSCGRILPADVDFGCLGRRTLEPSVFFLRSHRLVVSSSSPLSSPPPVTCCLLVSAYRFPALDLCVSANPLTPLPRYTPRRVLAPAKTDGSLPSRQPSHGIAFFVAASFLDKSFSLVFPEVDILFPSTIYANAFEKEKREKKKEKKVSVLSAHRSQFQTFSASSSRQPCFVGGSRTSSIAVPTSDILWSAIEELSFACKKLQS